MRRKNNLETEETLSTTTTEPTPVEKKPRAPRRTSKKPLEDAAAPQQLELLQEPPKRSRAKKVTEPEPSSAPKSDDSASPLKRRTRAKKVEPADVEPEPAPVQSLRDEHDLPIPTWRSAKERVAASPARSEAAAERDTAPRRSRRGQRRKSDEEVVVAPAESTEATDHDLPKPAFRKARGKREDKPTEELAAAASAMPQKPVAPAKPMIPIPDDAPQLVLRDGVPTIVRGGRVIPPIGFFGSCVDERRSATVFDEMRLAGEAGVHFHALLIELEVDEKSVETTAAFAGYLLGRAIKADKEAQVVFRVVFTSPRNWAKDYPDSRFNTAGGEAGDPSVCDDHYWSVAQRCLETLSQKLRMLDGKDHILGLHLERGEWFVPSGAGYDTSPAAKKKFRDWVRTRYSEDEVALRASWFDGSARFDSIEIPRYQPEGSEGDRFVRSSRKQRRYVDYHLFLSDATVDRLSELAYAAKKASGGYFLIGASYGYTFEWAHPGNGHLALGKLLRTHEIDFIAGPPSYKDREPGGTSPFPCPIDSFALNGKLYISEEDFKTSIGVGNDPDDFNPVIKTPQALENVHWRGVGAALAHGSGVTWMDLWGNGWLKTASIWDRAAKVRDSLVTRMGVPPSDPDVAVFIDERALAYLVDPNAFRLLVQDAREAVLRSGLSAGFYLLSDLAHRERFPESKLYLFLNAWDIRPELRSAIKERLQRDDKVLFWLYSAGLFDAGRDSIERARDVTGIALKPQPFHSKSGTTVLNRRHPLADAFPTRSIPASGLEPSYFGINEEAVVLGEYIQTGLPSFVIKEFEDLEDSSKNWTSVFLGEPAVSPALVRALGQMAGAHIWNFQDDVVHVRPPFLSVHCTGAGPRAITLPNKWSAYNLATHQWMAADSTHLRFVAQDGATYQFLVGLHAEIEQIINADRGALLRMEHVPQQAENTVRFDAISFDVPIMRLNEWIEGGVSDEAVEDWLLQPRVIDEEPEEEEMAGVERSNGRRRRRRRGGRPGEDRTGSEESVTARLEGTDTQVAEELEMNVLFRKRS